jgi:hypothetical protein
MRSKVLCTILCLGLAVGVTGYLYAGPPPAPVSAQDTPNQARSKAQATLCLSNAKQIGLATMMYRQDYDNVFPPKKASFKKVVFPYIKREDVFQCPLDAKGTLSYRLNANLAGTSSNKIQDPAKTIMLYEGKGDKPEFRHEGRAVIVSADGRAKLMTKQEAQSLSWYAGGAKPSKSSKK